MKKQVNTSLRWLLLRSLLVPLCSLWVVSSIVAYCLSAWFANDAYDKQLINSADSVVARIKFDGQKLLVDLPPAAQDILRHNNFDRFFYQVLTKDGARIFGDSVIPGAVKHPEANEPVLRDADIDGSKVRVARVKANIPNYTDQTVLVQVAETLNSRHQLTRNILMSILIPQLVLIALGAIAVWHGVSNGLRPLRILEEALTKRSQFDLTPVPQSPLIEIQPLVASINLLLTRLGEDIESQKRFVSNAAHQFRTPLAALKTYIYYAKRLPSNQQMNEVLDKIDNGTERMSHLSNKLLALAKAEPANSTASEQLVDLNLSASEVLSSFASAAILKNIELRFNSLQQPAFVKGDSHNLQELIANLVENAILYTPSGGVVRVTIKGGAQHQLSVSDTGCGIPVAERAHVFERFYRVLGNEVSGSGLGLAIVREIAATHDAQVAITSPENGVGTTVSVSFQPA